MSPTPLAPRAAVALLMLCTACISLATGCQRAASSAAEPVEFVLPELLQGTDVSLVEFDGDVVLLNFWTSWCAPCKIEIPELMQLQRRYKDRGFTVIGVVMDAPDGARRLARDLGINYTNVVGSAELADRLGGIHGYPTSFLLDRNREPVLKFSGLAPTRTLEREILAVIGTPG